MKIFDLLREDKNFNPDKPFAKALVEYFGKDDKGLIDILVPSKLYELEGFPKGLDLENKEILYVGNNFIMITAGGDWQQSINFKIELKDGKLKIIDNFEYMENQNKKEKTSRFKTLSELDKLNESKTFSGWKLQGKTEFQGLKISIENKKGSTRKGQDEDGKEWKTFMHYDYGYIRMTEGVDGDHVDCYLGPNKKSTKVFIVHQNNPKTKAYDEDKVMLGFDSPHQAKTAYKNQYDSPGFFGSMTTTDIETFKEWVLDKKHWGKRIKIKNDNK